jgi:diguanylate cyclase (GGDEF)-like protein
VISHFVAVKQDITARRQAEEKLAKAHAFLQLVIDTVPEPIMAIGSDYRIRMMNSTLQRQIPVGTTGPEPPFCYQVSHHRDSPCCGDEHPCPLQEVAAGKGTIRVEHTHITAAGEERYIEIIAAPLPSDDGSFEGIIESSRDITERRCAEEQLRYRAEYDALTGIPNRQLFYDRLQQVIALARREGRQIGVLFIDLDGFKAINDTLGHQAGDQLLQEVACRLLTCLRKSDTLARMGGDEFAVILINIGPDYEQKVVRRKIAAGLSPPFRIDGQDCRVGASLGMSVFPEDGDSPDRLLARADERMYRDKMVRKTIPGGNLEEINEG